MAALPPKRRISVYEQYGSKPLEALPAERLAFMKECLALRVEGKTYEDMVEITGKEYTTCRKAVKEALAQSVTEMADEVRAIEMRRLDEMLMAHWDQKGNPRSADVILKLMDRRSKYLGLDVPQTDLTDAATALREFVKAASQNLGAAAAEAPAPTEGEAE